ncbi:hypothetical protein [Acetivibrio clariflavus]|uniref:hypothetical protein n=1 Tax=Acetivibrio clariflavus TaxID=288965 RepID=UPI0009D99A99|nr:hypothetical protein [Acetivibrio clariflavus]
MVGWPHWHVIIWGRLVVNWILEKVFSLLHRVFFIFFKVGKILSPFWGIFIDNNSRFRWPTEEDSTTMLLDVKELACLIDSARLEKKLSRKEVLERQIS